MKSIWEYCEGDSEEGGVSDTELLPDDVTDWASSFVTSTPSMTFDLEHVGNKLKASTVYIRTHHNKGNGYRTLVHTLDYTTHTIS